MYESYEKASQKGKKIYGLKFHISSWLSII